jgi:hypothetical protein
MPAAILDRLSRTLAGFDQAKPVFVLSLCAWACAFYRFIVVDHKRSFGMWPVEFAIPGIFLVLLIGYYYWLRPKDRGDKIAARIISYVFLASGIAGALGY